ENLRAVAQLPVDWLGLIFYEGSARFVGVEPGLASWLSTPPTPLRGKKRVGVFVNAAVPAIVQATTDYGLNLIQLHGQESPEEVMALRAQLAAHGLALVDLIKAFSVHDDFDFADTEPYAGLCDYFLFDTKGKLPGGTGEQFDWTILDQYLGDTPFLLSGGIGPTDTGRVLDFDHPRCIGVDLNSRFEASPAVKDLDLLTTFLDALA
ncbi:MAG: phosphoribosylanthranilate isomerase, partial [Lewinella sp.]|nr:phosphoribosylanthranilate isomerase [Lewinella sp.]